MKRIFLAIELPDILKSEIESFGQKIPPYFRMVNPKQIHLTLAFLGTRPIDDIFRIYDSLKDSEMKRFTLELKETGFFSRKHKAHVLWIGVSKQEALWLLYKKLMDCLSALKIPLPDRKKFSPILPLAGPRICLFIGPRKSQNTIVIIFPARRGCGLFPWISSPFSPVNC